MNEQPPQIPNLPDPLYDEDTRLFLPMDRVVEIYKENSSLIYRGFQYLFVPNGDNFVEFENLGSQKERVNGKSIWTYQLQLRYPFKYSNHSECNPNIFVSEAELLTEEGVN